MLLIAFALAASLDLRAELAAVAALPGEPHIVSAAAIEDDGPLLTLEDGAGLDTAARRRVLFVSPFDGGDGSAADVVRAVRWLKTTAPAAIRAAWTGSGLPIADRAAGQRLARWAAFQAPDLIVEVGSRSATWPAVLTSENVPGLTSIRVVVVPADASAAALADALRSGESAWHAVLQRRADRDPLAMARVLATRYPQQAIMSYIPSVAWISMLRLAGITHESVWRDKVRDQTAPWLSGDKPLFGNTTPLTSVSGAMVFAEMNDVERSADLLKQPAQLAAAVKDDGTYANGRGWTDDMFMATAVLVRTGQTDLAARKLLDYAARLQRPDGLFIHGTDGPWAWGRGNGFAAFGAIEALSAMPATDPRRANVLDLFRRHMAALVKAQAPDGMWNEVIDEPGSYREVTATAMIFSAMARGVRLGWLDRAYRPVADRAWRALAAHVADDGSLVDVCESTGAGPTKKYYLDRKAIAGSDDRGGAMALMAAIERYETAGK